MHDPRSEITMEERRKLFEATVSAAQFFRSELLRESGGWPMEYLKDAQIENVLSDDSSWRVGYAPDTLTSLVDHLAAENFSYSTMERAGLVIRTGQADVVDRFRDRLVLLARDSQLRPAGFVGIGPNGSTQVVSPASPIHQPSNVLVGIEEQLDLLREGATPVIVNDPVDAIAVSNVSWQMDGRWAGIPVCGPALSTAQTRLLRKFTRGDQAIILLSGDEHRQKLTAGYVTDLVLHYDRIRAVVLDESPSALLTTGQGRRRMDELLTTARPALSFRLGGAAFADLELPDPGPDL